MSEQKINEDYLLVLINNNGLIDTNTVGIDRHFELESNELKVLCHGSDDNINDIVKFINNSLKPKLPNKKFNYCKELDKAYQSVHVNMETGIQDILNKRKLIFINQKNALKEQEEFNLEEKIRELKIQTREKIELWFKIFDTEFTYEKAKKNPKMLLYSHRISGWSSPEYKITDSLMQEVKTNFGYGSVSYLYSLLTYKNIQITPFSEWIYYRYANFTEVIKYTRKFMRRIPVIYKGKVKYFKPKIKNDDWHNAMEFTKNAANLSLTDEDEFINKYIIDECETMVNGLDFFLKETEHEFIDDLYETPEGGKIEYRVDLKGYELIDFRTEKIIGALDFISKIVEYNSIIPTQKYTSKIISINKKFIPTVYIALDSQNLELEKASEDYNDMLEKHIQLLEKEDFYQNEKLKLKNDFEAKYIEQYNNFQEDIKKTVHELDQLNHKVNLHNENVKMLNEAIAKYKQIVIE
jgi:hypothetical protein